ncbi:MAG: 4Fe-4S dicluster domain-containing protein [Bacteroidota bacterium]
MDSNNQQQPIQDTEAFRDKIATVNEHGKRNWIYPKKPKGKFYNWRSYVSYALLIFLFGTPFVKIGGTPLLLFNVLERKFILFGITFMPQDFHLFVLAMLTLIVFIILFTVVWGRLFCGWVCPQTIFMEMVFRKIEYWIEGDANAQKRLNKAPWTTKKMFKKALKQVIFFSISVLIANTFLAYIIGIEEVIKIATEPVQMHLGGFIAMLTFSSAFYFVFSYMREQVCIAICPYGRLQGVLLDANSIVVHYDTVRGEPRGKIRKNRKVKSNPVSSIQQSVGQAATSVATVEAEPLAAGANPIEQVQNSLGDCIDCKLCIHVCPTGIDIREGTQLECINCTACMDACDEVMIKVNRDPGLIRYDSYNGIMEGRKKLFTTRVKAYTVVLAVLLIVNGFLLGSRTNVETLLLRTPGTLFYPVNDDPGKIKNLYNYQIINKTQEEFPVEFKLMNIEGTIDWVGKEPSTRAGEISEGALFITLGKDDLTGRKNKIVVGVFSEGEQIDKVKTNFLGPVK